MKTIKILLAGGLAPNKFDKLVKELEGLLIKEDIKAEITTVNTYEQKDFTAFENSHHLIVVAGPNKIESTLPVINGMGLLYAWMDRNKMIQEIIAAQAQIS